MSAVACERAGEHGHRPLGAVLVAIPEQVQVEVEVGVANGGEAGLLVAVVLAALLRSLALLPVAEGVAGFLRLAVVVQGIIEGLGFGADGLLVVFLLELVDALLDVAILLLAVPVSAVVSLEDEVVAPLVAERRGGNHDDEIHGAEVVLGVSLAFLHAALVLAAEPAVAGGLDYRADLAELLAVFFSFKVKIEVLGADRLVVRSIGDALAHAAVVLVLAAAVLQANHLLGLGAIVDEVFAVIIVGLEEEPGSGADLQSGVVLKLALAAHVPAELLGAVLGFAEDEVFHLFGADVLAGLVLLVDVVVGQLARVLELRELALLDAAALLGAETARLSALVVDQEILLALVEAVLLGLVVPEEELVVATALEGREGEHAVVVAAVLVSEAAHRAAVDGFRHLVHPPSMAEVLGRIVQLRVVAADGPVLGEIARIATHLVAVDLLAIPIIAVVGLHAHSTQLVAVVALLDEQSAEIRCAGEVVVFAMAVLETTLVLVTEGERVDIADQREELPLTVFVAVAVDVFVPFKGLGITVGLVHDVGVSAILEAAMVAVFALLEVEIVVTAEDEVVDQAHGVGAAIVLLAVVVVAPGAADVGVGVLVDMHVVHALEELAVVGRAVLVGAMVDPDVGLVDALLLAEELAAVDVLKVQRARIVFLLLLAMLDAALRLGARVAVAEHRVEVLRGALVVAPVARGLEPLVGGAAHGHEDPVVGQALLEAALVLAQAGPGREVVVAEEVVVDLVGGLRLAEVVELVEVLVRVGADARHRVVVLFESLEALLDHAVFLFTVSRATAIEHGALIVALHVAILLVLERGVCLRAEREVWSVETGFAATLACGAGLIELASQQIVFLLDAEVLAVVVNGVEHLVGGGAGGLEVLVIAFALVHAALVLGDAGHAVAQEVVVDVVVRVVLAVHHLLEVEAAVVAAHGLGVVVLALQVEETLVEPAHLEIAGDLLHVVLVHGNREVFGPLIAPVDGDVLVVGEGEAVAGLAPDLEVRGADVVLLVQTSSLDALVGAAEGGAAHQGLVLVGLAVGLAELLYVGVEIELGVALLVVVVRELLHAVHVATLLAVFAHAVGARLRVEHLALDLVETVVHRVGIPLPVLATDLHAGVCLHQLLHAVEDLAVVLCAVHLRGGQSRDVSLGRGFRHNLEVGFHLRNLLGVDADHEIKEVENSLLAEIVLV